MILYTVAPPKIDKVIYEWSLVDLGSVASVCKHAFVGGQIPLLDVGIGRTGVHICIKYCGTCDVTLMSSGKWGSLPYSPDPTTNSETTNPNYATYCVSIKNNQNL